MEYNKNQFAKTDDKKVLHKVKKQWVVMSMALLATIGGGAVATKTSAHAATNNNGSHVTQASSANLSQGLSKTNTNSQNNSNVTNQASALHNKIVNNNANSNSSVHNYVGSVNNQFNNTNRNNVSNKQATVGSYVNNLNHEFGRTDQVQSNRNATVGNQANAPKEQVNAIHQVGGTSSQISDNSMPVTVMYIDGKNNGGNYRIQTSDGQNITTHTSEISVKGNPNAKNVNVNTPDNNFVTPQYSDVDKLNTFNGDADMGVDSASWHSEKNDTTDFNQINLSNNPKTISAGDITNNKPFWDSKNDRPLIIEKATAGADINVNYVNQSGISIGQTTIPGSNAINDVVDVTDSTKGGVTQPHKSDYAINDNTETTFQIGSSTQNITIPVHSIHSADVSIPVHLYQKGNSSSVGAVNVNESVPFGSDVTLSPSNNLFTSNPNLKGYNVDPSQSDATVYVADNGTNNGQLMYKLMHKTGTNADGSAKLSDLSSVNFTYDAGSSIGTVKPIHIIYKNHDGQTLNENGSDDKSIQYTGDVKLNNVNSSSNSSDYNKQIDVTDGSHKGVSVPTGYHLDPGQITKYTANGTEQTVTLYVSGNPITINSNELNIKRHVQRYKSNGYEDSGYNYSNGQDTGGNGIYSDSVDPSKINIHADVGDTFILDPGDYIPAKISNDEVTPQHNDIAVKVEGNGLKVTNANGNTISGGNGSGPLDVTFGYNDYPTYKTQSKIYIHYEMYDPKSQEFTSDVKVNGQSTTVSDIRVNGTKMSDAYLNSYKQNVPRGYQYAGIKSFNGNTVNGASDIIFGNTQKNTSSPVTGNLVIAVVPNIGTTTVYFRNQNGQYVDQNGHIVNNKNQAGIQLKTTTANKQSIPNVLDSSFNSRFGQKIDLASDKVDGDNVHVPTGYSIDKTSEDSSDTGHPEQYVFNNKFYPKSYTVSVHGNETNSNDILDEVPVHIHEYDPYGKPLTGNQYNYTVMDHIEGKVGDNFNISDATYLPQGYTFKGQTKYNNSASDKSDVKGYIDNNEVTPRSVTFNYVSNATTQNLQPVMVDFVNGNKVVSDLTIKPSDVNNNQPYNGETFDLRTAKGWKVPSAPYKVIPSQNFNATLSTKAQDPIDIQVINTNDADDGTVFVHRTFISQSSNKLFSDTVPLDEYGSKGSTYTIMPNDSRLLTNPKAFQVNEPTDNPITGKFNQDGTLSTTSGNETYVAISSSDNNPSDKPSNHTPTGKAEPIWVQYHDEKSDKPVGNNTAIDGYLGQDFSDVTKKVGLPTGYHLVDSPRVNYKITDVPQQVTLPIRPNSADGKDATATVTVHYEEANQPTRTHSYNVTISDGDRETFTPDEYMPQPSNEWSDDTSNSQDSPVTLSDRSGTLYDVANNSVDHQINFYYKAKQGANNTDVEPIFINFINQHGVQVNNTPTILNGKFDGETDNIQTGNNNGLSRVTPPSGYSYKPGDNLNVTFNNQPQEIAVPVQGNSENADFTVKERFIDANGSVRSDNVSMNQNANVGDSITFNPNKMQDSDTDGIGVENSNDNGYTPKSDYSNISATMTSDGSGNGKFSPDTSNTTYYYVQNHDDPQSADPVIVHFVDQNGNELPQTAVAGTNGMKKGSQVSDIMTMTQSDKAPKGYSLDNRYSRNWTYQHKSNTAIDDDTVHVLGNQLSNYSSNYSKITINRTEIQPDGSVKTLNPMPSQLSSSDRIGDTPTVLAGQYTPIGGYKPANGFPSSQTFSITADGNGNPVIKPSHADFTYQKESQVNAKDIHLYYMNQNGQYLDHNGNPSSTPKASDVYTIKGTNRNGDAINLNDANSQGPDASNAYYHGESTPKGYQLVSGQQTTVNFPTDHILSDTLIAYGKPMHNSITVTSYKDGQVAQTSHPIIWSRVGDSTTIGPISYTNTDFNGGHRSYNFQPSGTSINQSDNNQTVTMQPDGTLTNNNIIFNYTTSNKESAPLVVHFINQHGEQVGYSDTMKGTAGSFVDVTNQNAGGENIEHYGYSVDSGATTNFKLPKTNTTNVYVHVHGNNTTGTVSIYRVEDDNGQIKVLNPISHTISGNYGDSVTYFAGENGINPSDGYVPDERHPTHDTVTFGGTSNHPIMTPQRVVFYYNQSAQKSAPITIRFTNKNTGKQVGGLITEIGDVATPNNGLDKNRATNIAKDINGIIPEGYTIDSSNNLNMSNLSDNNNEKQFDSQPQVVNIALDGNQVNQTFTMHEIERNLNGTTATVSDSLSVNGHVGDTITVNPYQLKFGTNHTTPKAISNGYHSANTNANLNIRLNSDGSLSPLDSINYIYDQNAQSSKVGTITIHYISSIDNHQINEESDHATQGTNFSIEPYREDIPESMSSNDNNDNFDYDSSNTKNNDANSITKFTDSNQNVYVYVKPTDDSGHNTIVLY